MTEIFFVSQLCSKRKIDELLKKNEVKPLQSIQGYLRRLVYGLRLNGAKVTVLSSLPIKTGDYEKGLIRKSCDRENGTIYNYAPIFNVRLLRRPLLFVYYFVKVLGLKRGTICVCDLLCQTISFATYLGCKVRGNKCIAIVTDRPKDILGEKSIAYKIQSRFDGYVFMTEAMNLNINCRKKSYVVIEAICPEGQSVGKSAATSNKRIMYAGGLYKKYGIEKLLEAFTGSGIGSDGWELHLYGCGDISEEKYNSKNVFYHGVVSNDEVLMEESNSSLLVNPRNNNGDYTKYSFPSKLVEYFSSGTPTLMYKLDGVPEEYYNYCYVIKDDALGSMVGSLRELAGRKNHELREVGEKARTWVLKNKTPEVQAKKVIKMIREIYDEK